MILPEAPPQRQCVVVTVPGILPWSNKSFDRKCNKLIAKYQRKGWHFKEAIGTGYVKQLLFER